MSCAPSSIAFECWSKSLFFTPSHAVLTAPMPSIWAPRDAMNSSSLGFECVSTWDRYALLCGACQQAR